MNTIRILICACRPVLGFGVESLLASEADLEVINVVNEDMCGLLQAVAQYRPDTIILDKSLIMEDGNLLVSLLEELPEMRVIGVSAEDNWLHLYWKRDVMVTQAADFTEVVRSN